MNEHAFTTKQLASLGLPGTPSTAEGWRGIVIGEAWEYNEHPGRGRGGLRREYIPPAPLLDVIRRHLRGETVTEEEVRQARIKRPATVLRTGTGDTRRTADDAGAQAPYRTDGSDPLQQLTLRLGLLTHDTDWLPATLDVDQRAMLATRAYAALQAVARGPAALRQLADRPTVLDLALRLAWESVHPDSRGDAP